MKIAYAKARVLAFHHQVGPRMGCKGRFAGILWVVPVSRTGAPSTCSEKALEGSRHNDRIGSIGGVLELTEKAARPARTVILPRRRAHYRPDSIGRIRRRGRGA